MNPNEYPHIPYHRLHGPSAACAGGALLQGWLAISMGDAKIGPPVHPNLLTNQHQNWHVIKSAISLDMQIGLESVHGGLIREI